MKDDKKEHGRTGERNQTQRDKAAAGVKRLLSCLYVPKCVGCGTLLHEGEKEAALCPDCAEAFSDACRRQCPACLAEIRQCRCMPPMLRECGVTELYRVCGYGGEGKAVLTGMLYRLKHRHLSSVTEFFAEKTAERLRDELPALSDAGFRLCGVPRSPASIRRDGYDHVAELADALSRRTGLVVEPVFVRRDKGERQKELSAEKRRENARATLFLSENASPSGKRCLILDDVLTTGATVSRCAELLSDAGAAEVRVLVLATSERRRA